MPLDCCHPIASHHKLGVPDWYVSGLMLDRALDSIIKHVRIDRRHDIPYLAGYSEDGKTIYIDRHVPQLMHYRKRPIAVDRYLILHETVEKALISALNLHYQHAHQIALRAEEAAVLADKVPWDSYDKFMQRYIKTLGDERLTKLPADLDLKPYRDEHDTDLLKRMKKAMAKGHLPTSRIAKQGTSPTRKPAAHAH